MHPNPIFRQETNARNIAFARSRAFGTLAVNHTAGAVEAPLLSHIPFLLTEDGTRLEGHLVRSNPILGLLDAPVPAVLSVTGPDGYLSPDWYQVDDQVPTWNYVAVHLRGTLTRLPDADMHEILERLSASMEGRLAPKKPWTIPKMDQDIYQRMLRQIVPISMEVSQINGTWKLSQNKPDEVRLRAATALEEAGLEPDAGILADLMRNT